MNPRLLKQRVTIEKPVDAKDALGQPVPGWVTHAVVWADIRHQSGLESIKADATTSVVKASIRIRYRADVNASMRVAYGATIYNITAVLPDANNRQFIDLVCELVK